MRLASLHKAVVFLMGLTLPLHEQINSLFIMIGVVLLGIEVIKSPQNWNLRKSYIWIGIPAMFVGIRVIGVFTGEMSVAMDELTRSLPLLAIPLVFVAFHLRSVDLNIAKVFTIGVLGGLAVFYLGSISETIYIVISEDEPLEYIFRWRHMNFNFTDVWGMHPAYIGMLIVFVTVQILFANYFGKRTRLILLSWLLLFLFQLLARNAIFTFGIIVVFSILQKWDWRIIGYLGVALIGLMAITFFSPSNYIKDKFSLIDFQNGVLTDQRFQRLDASNQAFLDSPIFGQGPGKVDEVRKANYLKSSDTIAFEENYNSHNQFFEFLSKYGLVGFCTYLGVLIALGYYCVKNRLWVELGLIFAFLIFTMTESVLERSLGIKYFGVLIGLIWVHLIKQNGEGTVFDGSRS